jgi:hypothetical protein
VGVVRACVNSLEILVNNPKAENSKIIGKWYRVGWAKREREKGPMAANRK